VIRVTIKLAGPLRHHHRKGYTPRGEAVELPDGVTVGELLKVFAIKEAHPQLITINRQKATPETVLTEGDVICVIPRALGG